MDSLTLNSLIKVAVDRGYSLIEAKMIADKIQVLIASGNYSEAYSKYISRLCS